MPSITVGEETLEYVLRHSRKARRGRIVVTPAKVELVVPRGADLQQLHRFVQSKVGWIRSKQHVLWQRAAFAPQLLPDGQGHGARLLIEGRHERFCLVRKAIRRARVQRQDGRLVVCMPSAWDRDDTDATIGRVLEQWMRREVRRKAELTVLRYAGDGMQPREVRVKDQRCRWGSCGATGIINLNWRLGCLPPHAFDYVVVHELCHLLEPNHSRRFWALVEQVLPVYRRAKRELHEYDALLEQGLIQ